VLRQHDPVLAVVQWGVSFMMHEVASVGDKPLLLDEDFKSSSKIQVQNHLYNNQTLPSKYKVKEYSPLVFRDLRKRFKEEPEDYGTSICDGALDDIEPRRGSSTIYYTSDLRLVLKTLSKEDVAHFHNIFNAYYKYVVECNSETLLPHYLGMYRITVHEKDTYFVVMKNIISAGLEIHRLYDLKGSTVERNASEKELQKDVPVLKDNDFTSNQEKIKLGPDKDKVMAIVTRDIKALEAWNAMDYALCVAIHNFERTPPQVDRQRHICCYGDGTNGALYFIGLVSVLTSYNAKKKAAHAAKTAKHGGKAEFTTVNPEQYGKRFLDFIASVVE